MVFGWMHDGIGPGDRLGFFLCGGIARISWLKLRTSAQYCTQISDPSK